MRRAFVCASLAGALASAAADASASNNGEGGWLTFAPMGGVALPLGGTSPIDAQLGVGGFVGAAFGWQFQGAPVALLGRLDYTHHEPVALASYADPRSNGPVYGSGTTIVDATFNPRYWVSSRFFADGVLGWTATSVVRIRQLPSADSGLAVRAHRDLPTDSGVVFGTGIGFALVRLTSGSYGPDAPMLTVGIDWRLRLLGTGALLTLPINIGLTL